MRAGSNRATVLPGTGHVAVGPQVRKSESPQVRKSNEQSNEQSSEQSCTSRLLAAPVVRERTCARQALGIHSLIYFLFAQCVHNVCGGDVNSRVGWQGATASRTGRRWPVAGGFYLPVAIKCISRRWGMALIQVRAQSGKTNLR